MATVYVPDDRVSKILNSGKDKGKFVLEAIDEKLERDGHVS